MLPSNDVFNRIGQSVVNGIGLDWQSASITVILKDEGVLAIESAYLDKDGIRRIFVVPNAALKEFYNLYIQMAESPKGKWKKMIYTIMPEMQFKVDFEY